MTGPGNETVTSQAGPERPVILPERRAALGRRARLLAGTSVTYNAVEAVASIAAGAVASSVALVGFGLDSVMEMSSGLIILWQFRHPLPQSRERQALRMLAVSFFALAAYVSVESVRALAAAAEPDRSPVGIVIAALSLLVMPSLSWAQRRTGLQLGSATVVADSKQTLLCTYLSAVLLLGLALNATFGWWWADPAVGLVVAALALREGWQAWQGDACTCIPSLGEAPTTLTNTDAQGDCQDGCCTPAPASTPITFLGSLPKSRS